MESNKYLRIEELGWDLKLLKDATIFVVGAGALGNEVLKNLALLGVGKIFVSDMDKIEAHNLTRTVLFRESDIGKFKARVAADRVREINPDCNIVPFLDAFQKVWGLGLFQEADIVLGCLDNIQARIDLNKACFQTNTVYIDAGLRFLDGDLKTFGEGYSVCLDCGLSQALRDEAWRRFSCLKLKTEEEDANSLPTAPSIASIMAGLQVQIAIKALHHKSIPLNIRLSVLGNIDEFGKTELSFNSNCPTHKEYEFIPPEIIEELKDITAYSNLKKLWSKLTSIYDERAFSIDLDFDLVLEAHCLEHKSSIEIMKLRGSVFLEEMQCAKCIDEQKTGLESIMQEEFCNQINERQVLKFGDKSLLSIGIPHSQIIKVNSFYKGEILVKYFKLADSPNFVTSN